MAAIKSYIKERAGAVLLYCLSPLILFAVAGLYGYQKVLYNMLYALFLVGFFGVCFLAFDFARYLGRHRKLMDVARQSERDGNLPQPNSLEEEIYQEMVVALEEEKRRLVTEYDEKKRDMADYYTMWIHQVKTPIAALGLLLEGGEDAAAGKSRGRQAMEELFKIEQYAEMALHYARLESLSSDLLLKPYDVYQITKQAVKKYGVLFIGSGLSFSMEEFSIQAVTDEKWLCFVLEQLLSNALKYTPGGGISIYGADAQGRKRQGGSYYMAIEDTGMGIREEDLPRIFERGFIGYNGRMDKKSTGIGLYLCRQIMNRLSHTMRVESQEGKGTKVILGFVQE